MAGKRKPSQSLLNISEAGIKRLKDLAWIIPSTVQQAPSLSPFNNLEVDKLFLGSGKVISLNMVPAFNGHRNKKIPLFNITCVVKDDLSESYLNLKWFNAYPNLKKEIESVKSICFMGKVSDYRGSIQIVNPKLNPKFDPQKSQAMLVDYPTVNSVPSRHIKSIIKKIPLDLWPISMSIFPSHIEKALHLMELNKAFIIIHGLINASPLDIELAKERIIYEEFCLNQLKIMARKFKNRNLSGLSLSISHKKLNDFKKLFPYELTHDQNDVVETIISDFRSGHPMMRMLQGDVGCGKTTVAIIAALITIENQKQVAFMCPTEALAIQHTKTLASILHKTVRFELLLGSTTPKEKRRIYEELSMGKIDLLIGTHSLIQDSINFKSLGLSIIDEQHKFGVQQRLKLTAKGAGAHTLIMSATPIPRTLQLAQYGDLDISTIRVMPGGRKGIKTRIVTPTTYEKYLSFIKTRMSLGEQVYIVVPAIEESENFNLNNIIELKATYAKYFPEYKSDVLHGQLSSAEKQSVMSQFEKGEIDLLIATTVIEVGINVLNSTVISIYNPDRFGMSSLHQLRGRVGRGDKPGFCFLITDDQTSKESLKRIKIIEKTVDGFEIAEADLKNRGEGELFGQSQSGHTSSFQVGSIITHFKIFEKVSKDIEILKTEHTEYINQLLLHYIQDAQISSTI